MPFGRLVKKQLEKGVNLLFDIRDLIIALDEAKKGQTGKTLFRKLLRLSEFL